MRESVVEQYLKRSVEAEGGEVRKVRWIGRRSAPDRLVMLPDRGAVYVELKAPGEAPTRAQQREHDRMRRCRLQVLVIDSLEGVDAFVERFA